MWQLLGLKVQGLITIGAAFLVLTGIYWAAPLLGLASDPPLLQTSFVAFIVTVVLFQLADFLWFRVVARSKWAQSKTFPDLNGTWTGKIRSTWTDDAGKRAIRQVTVTIKQSLLSIHVSLESSEGGSESMREVLNSVPRAGRFQVYYSYINKPAAKVRFRSQPHDGFAFLEYDTSRPGVLKGRYFTERETSGDIELTRME